MKRLGSAIVEGGGSSTGTDVAGGGIAALKGGAVRCQTGLPVQISASIKAAEHDFHLHLVELQNAGQPQALTFASFIGLCSTALSRPVQSQMAVMGDMSLGGKIVQVRNLAESLQVAFDAGAKKILLPMSSVVDIPTVPGSSSPNSRRVFIQIRLDAVFKAIGVE